MQASLEGKQVVFNINEKVATSAPATTDASVFEASDEILKKHLPEALDMLSSRNTAFTQLTQQLEEDFIAAQRLSTQSPTNNNQNTHNAHNHLKTPHMVLQEAKEQVQRMSRCLVQDLDRVTSDINELLTCQTLALSSITSDVQFLSSRLQQIQRHHYDESTVNEMTLKSTVMQHHHHHHRPPQHNHSQVQDIKTSRGQQTVEPQDPFIVTLPLSEVIPPDMHLSLLQSQQQQHTTNPRQSTPHSSTLFNGGANQTGAQLNVSFA